DFEGRGGFGSGHDSQLGSGVSPVTTVPRETGFACSIVAVSVIDVSPWCNGNDGTQWVFNFEKIFTGFVGPT
ncbi:MAG: hypothetical protein ACK5XN_25420, partial [Bacteroidota bacterium]